MVYWQQFRVQDDIGINKKIFLAVDPKKQPYTIDEIANLDPETELTFSEIVKGEEIVDG